MERRKGRPSSFMERNPVAWLSGRHDRGIGITLEHGMAVLSNPRRDKNRSINALYIRGLEYADGMRKLKGLPVKKNQRKSAGVCPTLPLPRKFLIFRVTWLLYLYTKRMEFEEINGSGLKVEAGKLEHLKFELEEGSNRVDSPCVASSFVRWYSSGN